MEGFTTGIRASATLGRAGGTVLRKPFSVSVSLIQESCLEALWLRTGESSQAGSVCSTGGADFWCYWDLRSHPYHSSYKPRCSTWFPRAPWPLRTSLSPVCVLPLSPENSCEDCDSSLLGVPCLADCNSEAAGKASRKCIADILLCTWGEPSVHSVHHRHSVCGRKKDCWKGFVLFFDIS